MSEINPDVKMGFFPIPSLSGEPSVLVGGEGDAYGAAKDSDMLEASKALLAFLAQPENLKKFNEVNRTVPGLTSTTVDYGLLQESYDAWVTPGDVPLEPVFDRVYLPNGFWDTMTNTASGVLSGTMTPEDAVKTAGQQFEALARK